MLGHDIYEIALAAGIFEGEGCIYMIRAGGCKTPAMNLTSTDEDTVRRFAAAMRLGLVHGPYHRKNPWTRRDGTKRPPANTKDVLVFP